MEKSKRKNGEMPLGVFEPTWLSKFVTAMLIIIVSSGFAIALKEGTLSKIVQLGEFSFVFLPIVGAVLYVIYLQNMQSIYVYEDRIEHRYGSSRKFARWDELSHFGQQGARNTYAIGIFSTLPLHQNNTKNAFARLLHGRWDEQFLDVTSVIKVPVNKDSVDWNTFKETEFGRLINEYAPHLFEGDS